MDITGINAEIALLNTMINSLKTVITLANAAGKQIALVLAAWQAMETDITTVIGDINAAETDLSSLNLVSLKRDLNQANTDWQALSNFCKTIAGIQYLTATPATVTLPTSAAAAAAA